MGTALLIVLRNSKVWEPRRKIGEVFSSQQASLTSRAPKGRFLIIDVWINIRIRIFAIFAEMKIGVRE